MDIATVRACHRGSADGTMTFPEVLARLSAAGVERYTVDLAALEARDFGRDGEAHSEPLPLSDLPSVASTFDEAAVQAAILDSQRGRITYTEFLRRAMLAGVAAYTVFLEGRRVVYTGRHGDAHLEPFPPAP